MRVIHVFIVCIRCHLLWYIIVCDDGVNCIPVKSNIYNIVQEKRYPYFKDKEHKVEPAPPYVPSRIKLLVWNEYKCIR